jgi:RNA recognition motif-containing protein
MQLFVGNLPYTTTESDLEELFGSFGEVLSVKIIADRYTGKSRGFGFVEMSNSDQAKEAITGLNDSDQLGRKIVVKEANEKERTGGPRGDRPERSGDRRPPSRDRDGHGGRDRRPQRDY